VQFITRSAIVQSTERLNLPFMRDVVEEQEQETNETESCQALVHTCYHNVLVLVVCTI
jgi:hypothetical protein